MAHPSSPGTAPRRSDPATDPVGLLRERLLDREEQLRTAQEMAEFGIWEWDIPTGAVTWSGQLHTIYGTDPGSFEPSYDRYLERVHPDDREHVNAVIQQAYQDHQSFEFDERIVRPDGSVRILHSRGRVTVDMDDRPLRMVGVCQDVTEQRRADEAVRETAHRLGEAQSIAQLGSWEWDVENDRVVWSDELFRIFGIEPAGFTGSYSAYLAQVHPEDRERVNATVQAALNTGDDIEVEHRVTRPDGSVRVVEARARTITDDTGKVIRMVGTGRDVTEHREAQAQAARAEVAIEIAHRLADLQRITEAALTHLGLDELLPELLARICQTLSVENAAVYLLDEDGESLVLRAARGADESEIGLHVAVGGGFAGRVAAERRPVVVGQRAYEHVISPGLRSAGVQAMVGVPLIVGKDVLGVLYIGTTAERSFGTDEIALLELAADRAAMAIEHAHVFERERGTAETLQRALLPAKVPDLGPMSAAVRYVPATADIGGDWYDVIPLANGHVGVVLGDVTGHGLDAAALMAQLRHSLRAYALEGLSPSDVADRLDLLIHTPDLERLATLVYAVISPELSIDFVNAGHLPPLLVPADADPHYLESESGVPIGCQAGGYVTAQVDISPGDILVLYTDGLIERRGESIDDGLERLRDAAATAPNDPAELADHLLRLLMPGHGGEDDMALLAIRPERVPVPRP
jgi:sigma-B regulation protein RsbU (phosphoserine phosphatase)